MRVDLQTRQLEQARDAKRKARERARKQVAEAGGMAAALAMANPMGELAAYERMSLYQSSLKPLIASGRIRPGQEGQINAAMGAATLKQQMNEDRVRGLPWMVAAAKERDRRLALFGPGRGGIPGFARGGVVPGMGSTDSVLAALTPGEVVIPKGVVQHFASGGRVNGAGYNGYGNNGNGFGGSNAMGGMNEMRLSTEAQQALAAFSDVAKKFAEPAASFGQSVGELARAAISFGSIVDRLKEAITGFPSKVELTGDLRSTIKVEGGGKDMLGPEAMKQVEEKTTKLIEEFFRRKLPDAP